MQAFEQLRAGWVDVEKRFLDSEAMRRLFGGAITERHYTAYLRETYFYTRENPQIQAVATAWFRGPDRQMVKSFLRHALSEVGHDALALADLKTLGYDPSSLPGEEPLSSTVALIGFPYYAIQYRSCLSYLGYLFFLEFLPTSRGQEIATALAKVGVPPKAMTFLVEHQSIDVHHNRFMQDYANAMLRRPSDVAEVLYCMGVTGELYARMIESAFRKADEDQTASPKVLAA